MIDPILIEELLATQEDDIREAGIPQLAKHIRDVKTALDEVKSVQAELQKHYDHITINVAPEMMDEEGVEVTRIKDVGRLQMKSDIRCTTPSENRDQLIYWLQKNGCGSMVKNDVNASTLKAFVKDAMKNGSPYPEELLNIHPYTRATVVKA